MSDLDQELEQAIAESEEGSSSLGAASVGAPGSADLSEEVVAAEVTASESVLGERPAARRNIGLLIGLLAVVGGILTLVLSSANDAAIYSVPVNELMENQATYAARNVRVEGTLVKGSLKHRAEPCEYRFYIEKNEKRVEVRYAQCVVPDTFRDVPDADVQVTAEGRMNTEGFFEASLIMAKCPSKYEMEQSAARGEQAPHGPGGAALPSGSALPGDAVLPGGVGAPSGAKKAY